MSIHFRCLNVVIFVDRNNFQSALSPSEVKPIHDLNAILKGFGFPVTTISTACLLSFFSNPDGHSLKEIELAWQDACTRCGMEDILLPITLLSLGPTVIICNTTKAGGSSLLGDTKTKNLWHTKVPAFPFYFELIEEQINLIGDSGLSSLWNDHKSKFQNFPGDSLRPNYGESVGIFLHLFCHFIDF